MMKRTLLNLFAASIVSLLASLGLVYAVSPILPSVPNVSSIPFTFTNGTVANATQMNTNFTSYQTQINAAIASIQTQVNAFQTSGSWTPADASGAGLSFSAVSANYTQIGNMVHAYATLTYPTTASGATALIGGLPVAVAGSTYAGQCFVSQLTGGPANFRMGAVPGGTTISLFAGGGTSSNTQVSTSLITFECIYPAS